MQSLRNVYSHRDLVRVIQPRTVALVGASPKESSFAGRTQRNMRNFSGSLYLVNPKYDTLGDSVCYPRVSDLPETPDCVLIATPREAVEPIVEDCVRAGVGGIIVYASGYAETSLADRVAQQQRLADLARESGVRIIGPNCIGILNYRLGMALSFTSGLNVPGPTDHAIGVAIQSGAMGIALTQAIERGMSFSHLLTAGNSCDVDVADYVSFLVNDPDCKVIACSFEGLNDPDRLIQAARLAWEADKPLVVYKLATSSEGAAAAASHTGSLAGSDAAYRAALSRHGAVIVDRLESLLETAAFFAKAPVANGKGIAVVSPSGGAAIMAADMAERHKVRLPQPSGETRSVLEAHIPEFGAARNPCDATAQVANNPSSLEACSRAMLNDPAYDALVLANVYAQPYMVERAGSMAELASGYPDKPICMYWGTEWLEGPGAIEFERSPLALFRSLDRCFETLAMWQERSALRRSFTSQESRRISSEQAAISATEAIASSSNPVLTESDVKKILSDYGVPVVRERLVQDITTALDAAKELGYPVALKVDSAFIPHKTEAGVVRIGLGDADAVQQAFAEIMNNALSAHPAGHINGVLVQPMVPAGVEIIIGAKVDPQFGALIAVGLGGVFVELLKDTVLELAPVTHTQALSMLDRLRGRAVLRGFRGSPPVDESELADIIVRISEMAHDLRDLFQELDINPVICNESGIVAVDGLIIR